MIGIGVQEVRLALRTLLKDWGFTAVGVVSLGIGIGACTAVFAVIQAVLFSPLPYPEADRLVEVWSTPSPSSLQRIDAVPAARLRRWLDQEFRSLEGFAARGSTSFVLEGDVPERIQGQAVSGAFFETMGVPARFGRTLIRDDDRPGAQPAVVLSETLWEERFDGDRSVLGQVATLSGIAYTVVGVMPRRFDETRSVWIPANELLDYGGAAWFPVGRLRADATFEEAVVEVQQRAAAELATDSTLFGGYGSVAIPLGEAERSAGNSTLWVLVGAVGAVLLLVLTNLSALFLTRAAQRGRSAAVRMALGANSWQLGRGLVLESVLLAVAGAALGVLLAVWGKDLILWAMGAEVSARTVINLQAMAFAAALAAFAAAVVGLEPLRHSRGKDLSRLLQRGSAVTTLGPGERRTRNLIVAVQVGLTLALTSVGGVLSVAYENFGRLDVGYDAESVVAAFPDYEIREMTGEEQQALGSAVAERLSGFPGVEAVALWRMGSQRYPPGPEFDAVFDNGMTELPVRLGLYRYYDVSPGFFRTLGIPLLSGRGFGPNDGPASPPVGIVSEGGARAWWPGQDAIGRRLKLGQMGEWITVVGVAEDAADLHEMGRSFSVGMVTRERHHMPLLYRPINQSGIPPEGWLNEGILVGLDGVVVAARVPGDPSPIAVVLREELGAVAPDLPLRHAGTLLDWQLGAYGARQLRLYRGLLMGVASAGFLLALLGIAGVVTDGVVRRTREIGVRKALGARSHHVIFVLAKESVLTAGVGLAAGLLAVPVLNNAVDWNSPYYQDLLLGVSITDWRVFSLVSVALLLVTVLTSCLWAFRADRIEPATALRVD